MLRFSIPRPGPFAVAFFLLTHLQAAPIQWTAASGGNDNWYEYIPSVSIFESISFNNARSAALARTHMGMNGYLATVTSAAEQAVIEGFPILIGFSGNGSAWIGGSSLAAGGFRWVDGPEAGQSLTYTNWLVNQPVSGDTFIAHLRWPQGTNGWISGSASSGAFGYIVEYGDGVIDSPSNAIPEPSTWTLIGAGILCTACRLRRRKRN